MYTPNLQVSILSTSQYQTDDYIGLVFTLPSGSLGYEKLEAGSIMLCYTTQHYVVLYYTALCCVILYSIMLCYSIQHYVVLYYTALCSVIVYSIMLCYSIQHYVVLYYTALCCVIFYSIMLCYILYNTHDSCINTIHLCISLVREGRSRRFSKQLLRMFVSVSVFHVIEVHYCLYCIHYTMLPVCVMKYWKGCYY